MKEKTYTYCVADFTFRLRLPRGIDAERLLPSFAPFSVVGGSPDKLLFDFCAEAADSWPAREERTLLEQTNNDMGHLDLYSTPEGYEVEIEKGGFRHLMVVDRAFTSAKAWFSPADPLVGDNLSSLVRIVYAQAIIPHSAISLHAAAVSTRAKAYLFMGRSGTGKSTHAALWREHIAGTSLLNDDNPTVRLLRGEARAYGTPWSGKTPCYKNLNYPIGGMVRLRQAPVNAFCRQEGAEAFMAIYPGCSLIAQDERLRNCLYDTLALLAGMVAVGTLNCTPAREAAILCYQSLWKDGEE